MSPPEPSPGDVDTAQTVPRNRVVVTGAGFTRALVPGAPLLVDDFSNDVLEARVRGLPNASRLLDWERSLDERGRVDIERLMTRLDALMPYDYAESAGNAANEYGFLLSELRRAFLDRLHEARKGDVHREELKRFATYCEANGCCCITFNYDDFLDEALAQTGSWNPYWGYGFFCPSSLDTIASFDELETNSVLRLLKLHGSINWRPKLGYASPVAIDTITHHRSGMRRCLSSRPPVCPGPPCRPPPQFGSNVGPQSAGLVNDQRKRATATRQGGGRPPLQSELSIDAHRRPDPFHGRHLRTFHLAAPFRFAGAFPPGVLCRLLAHVPVLRTLWLNHLERGNALAGDRLELFAQRRPVIRNQFGAVARAGDLHVEALERGQVRVVGLHGGDDVVDGAALKRMHGGAVEKAWSL